MLPMHREARDAGSICCRHFTGITQPIDMSKSPYFFESIQMKLKNNSKAKNYYKNYTEKRSVHLNIEVRKKMFILFGFLIHKINFS